MLLSTCLQHQFLWKSRMKWFCLSSHHSIVFCSHFIAPPKLLSITIIGTHKGVVLFLTLANLRTITVTTNTEDIHRLCFVILLTGDQAAAAQLYICRVDTSDCTNWLQVSEFPIPLWCFFSRSVLQTVGRRQWYGWRWWCHRASSGRVIKWAGEYGRHIHSINLCALLLAPNTIQAAFSAGWTSSPRRDQQPQFLCCYDDTWW